MIDLSRYRIIDLSHELFPSEQKTDGRQRHGKPFFGERAIDRILIENPARVLPFASPKEESGP